MFVNIQGEPSLSVQKYSLFLLPSGKAQKSPRASKSEESKSHEKKDKRIDVEVTVSYFVSPSEFHVQLASAGKDGLDEYV